MNKIIIIDLEAGFEEFIASLSYVSQEEFESFIQSKKAVEAFDNEMTRCGFVYDEETRKYVSLSGIVPSFIVESAETLSDYIKDDEE